MTTKNHSGSQEPTSTGFIKRSYYLHEDTDIWTMQALAEAKAKRINADRSSVVRAALDIAMATEHDPDEYTRLLRRIRSANRVPYARFSMYARVEQDPWIYRVKQHLYALEGHSADLSDVVEGAIQYARNDIPPSTYWQAVVDALPQEDTRGKRKRTY